MVEMLLRSVLSARPRYVRKFISKFFEDPDLRNKINDYVDVRAMREREREQESVKFTKRTEELTDWRTVLKNSRENEKLVREMEKKQKTDNVRFVEYIRTEYFDSVCELFLNRPQYTEGENSLLRQRVVEFLKKFVKSDEEVNRLMQHYDVVFRKKETLNVVKRVLDETLDKLPVTDLVAPTSSGLSRDSYTDVWYKLPGSWDAVSC